MPTYTEKKRARLVPLESYNPAKPVFIRHTREEMSRNIADQFGKQAMSQVWRRHVIMVNGEAKYSQDLGRTVQND